MALDDVITRVTDGLQAADDTGGEGVHIKIGVSQATDMVTVRKGMTADTIHGLLGRSPLADAAIVSLEMGAGTIYCLPVAPAVQGTTGTITHTGTGAGTVTVSGSPSNALDIIVEITGQGGLNTGIMRYSVDGGANYTGNITIPLSGAAELPGTGLTLAFTETADSDTQYAIGDTYRCITTAPTAGNESILAAMTQLQQLRQEFEYIHIVGAAAPELWAGVSVLQQVLAVERHKPCLLLLESPAPTAEETLDAYVTGLETARRKVENCDMQVCVSRCIYTRGDGLTAEINCAAIAAGQYAAVPPQQSIGQIRTGAVPEDKMTAARPDGIGAYLDRLDRAGYMVYRQYDGIAGWYVANANTFAPETSNYRYAESVRVRNKLLRLMRKEALLQLQTNVDPANIAAELQTIAQYVAVPAEQMVRDGEISSVDVTVPADGQSTRAATLYIRYRQQGVLRQITLDIGALGS